DWRRSEVDLLFEVPCRPPVADQAALVCVQVEHQSREDQAMPLRMLLHGVLYWQEVWRRWEQSHVRGRPLRLPLVFPIFFHTGPDPWQAPRTLADLIAVPPEWQLFVPRWEPVFWDLAGHPAEELVQASGPSLRSLAVVRSIHEERETFLQRYSTVLRGLEPLHDQDRMRWQDLVWFLMSYAVRRRPEPERAALFDAAVASQTAVAFQQEVRTMSQQVQET